MLDWATDFLSRREMRTKNINDRSSLVEVTSEVPQGSVLAPKLFSIDVSDTGRWGNKLYDHVC